MSRTAGRVMGRRVGRLRRAGLLLILAAGIVIAACGIPTQNAPSTISKDAVPFNLLSPSSPTTTAATTPPVASVSEPIYLVAPTQHVSPVFRNIAPPANLTQIIGALLEGPTSAESSIGLQTFLAGKASDVVVTVANGIATVNFAANPVQGVGPSQILAISQVVFTAMAQPNIAGVTFQIAGTAVEVPTAGGAQVPGPVNDNTYAPQAPLVPGATTTLAK
ncbi:MAG TPA: GerMN domain-containing protein [Acidimicrobiales bacterium]|nr:GerMN domain-containing protein [Acidimicrobiales bacterium]